jgi:putative redox protein
MKHPTPPMTATLAWDSALEFTGLVGKHEVGLDGASYTAPSPMQMLALSLAGCMAIDLVHILKKGRHNLTSLDAAFTGERAPEEPKRFTKIRLHFTLVTDAPPERIDRALRLSREKYCSVWGTFRQDIELETTYSAGPVSAGGKQWAVGSGQ